MFIERFLLFGLLYIAFIVDGSHFRGGTITSRPYNSTPSGTTALIVVRERFSWRRSAFLPLCDSATIAAQTSIIGDAYSTDYLTCVAGSCGTHWPTTTMPTPVYCTDFNAGGLDVASGEYFQTFVIPLHTSFSIGYTSCCWFATLVNLVGSGYWAIVGRISTVLRPDGYLNTSPVAVTLPIVYKVINTQHVHVVQMSDFDGTDKLQCRFSTSSTSTINGFDECGDMCTVLSGATLFGSNCTIVFQLTVVNWYAGVALQIEDFYNAAALAANTPMSSVPMQFLFYGYAVPTGCATPPAIIGERPNRACIGVMPGDNITETVIVQVNCPGKTIVDFISSVPIGMQKSSITAVSATQYHLVLTWVPLSSQYGPQAVCMGAIDNTDIQSNQWCITFLVGFKSPDVIRPQTVQHSASPVGTIFVNHTVFSIQTSISVNRPTRNDTFIYFWDATAGNTLTAKYDCGWSPEITYTGFTIVIRFPVAPWIVGHFYYVTMDSGVASGTEFCGPESAPITSKTFWVFNIWNPAVSSTTTTTTTPPTTVTATTRPTSTTSINTALTTTGIVITNATPIITTSTTSTTTTSTTTLSTTAGLTASATTTLSTVAVMYPKDLEEACKQPIAAINAVVLVVFMPIHALAMYAMFTKLSKAFNPLNINAKLRHQQRMRRVMRT